MLTLYRRHFKICPPPRRAILSALQVPLLGTGGIGVDNGIQAGKLMFSRLWVDATTCAWWLDGISQYRQEWDDKRGIFKDVPLHDWTSHGADRVDHHRIARQRSPTESAFPSRARFGTSRYSETVVRGRSPRCARCPRTVLVAQVDAHGRFRGSLLGCRWALLLGLRRFAGAILLQGRSPLFALRVRRYG